MVCIVCLADKSTAKLSMDYQDSGILFDVEFCVEHAHAAQDMIKKWIFKTRESVLVAESDKNRWDKTTPTPTPASVPASESTEASE